jgi:Flp pilus assembly protein TadD
MGRRAALAALVVAVAALASSVVVSGPATAVVAVDRLGDGVRLLSHGLSFSFWLLARRVDVPRVNGAAVFTATLTAPLPGGAELPVRLDVALSGSGPLPVSARTVRAYGLQRALAAALAPRLALDASAATALLHTSPAWREIFPTAPGAPPDVDARLAPAFAPLRLDSASLTASADPALARGAARDVLRRVAPARGRLVVIGLDALDWGLVGELTRRGVMPNLAALLARGAQAVVNVPPPLLSPLIWTTYATGEPPEVHGVLDFVEPDPLNGTPRPVSSRSRKVSALWEMTAAAGRSTAVIGWWATFPAAAPPGCTIYSDRLSEQLMSAEGEASGLADPPDAAAAARRLAVRGNDATPALLAPIIDVTASELAAVPTGAASWDDPIGGAARLMAASVTVERLTDRELERGTDVVLSYLEGTDTVGHLFAPYRPPPMPGVDPSRARRFGQVVDRYYAWVDAWLGRIAAGLNAADTLVILSDHGFHWGVDRPTVAAGAHTPTAVYWHKPGAFFLAVGPDVRPTTERRTMNALDVTPTLLALAGLPGAADLPGRVPAWLLRSGAPAPTVRYAALAPPQRPSSTELSAEARTEDLAKLRALGYLAGGESTHAPSGGPTPTPAPTAIPGRMEARRLHNLALSRAASGDLAGAEEAFRAAIAADASYPPTHYAYAHLLRKLGRYDEADRELWAAVDAGLGDPAGSIVRVAEEYHATGQADRAGTLLAKASARYPDNEPIWLDLGTIAGEQRDFKLARDCLERAVALAPGDPYAYRNLAAAKLAVGDVEGGRRALTRALELDPGNAQVKEQLERLGGPVR